MPHKSRFPEGEASTIKCENHACIFNHGKICRHAAKPHPNDCELVTDRLTHRPVVVENAKQTWVCIPDMGIAKVSRPR